MNSTDKLVITLRSSIHDDPFVKQDSQYARDMKAFLSAAESQGGKIVPPRIAMDSAEIQTVLELFHLLLIVFLIYLIKMVFLLYQLKLINKKILPKK